MGKNKPSDIEVKAFATHHVITQPNPLRTVLRRVEERGPGRRSVRKLRQE